MTKRILLTLIFALSISLLKADNINGKWFFKSILHKNDTSALNLKPIIKGDFLILNNDSTFEYILASIPLKASGNWSITDTILRFHYKLPNDTMRSYNITFNNSNLILFENGVNYTFTKKQEKGDIKNTSTESKMNNGLAALIAVTLLIVLFVLKNKKK